MPKLLFLLIISAVVLSAGEGTVPFRSGKILSAETSSRKPTIASDRVKDTPGGTWLELVVKLNPGRTLGCFDYNLEVNGQKYPCRAIARNQEKYDADVWEINDPLDGDKFRMLFNPPKQSGGKYKMTTYRPKPEYPEIESKDKASDEFTPVSEISDKGVLGKDAPAPAPAPQEEPAKTEAPAADKEKK